MTTTTTTTTTTSTTTTGVNPYTYFRNIENNGVWERGGIYTFEVYHSTIAVGDYPVILQDTYVWTGKWINSWIYVAYNAMIGGHFDKDGFWDSLTYGYDMSQIHEDIETVQRSPYTSYPFTSYDRPPVWNRVRSRKNGMPESLWIYSDKQYKEVNDVCEISTSPKDRNFGVVGSGDTIQGPCNEEKAFGGLGQILFSNNNEDLTGSVFPGLEIISIEDLGDDWLKYTVKVSENIAAGTYYVKGKTFLIESEGLPT